LIIPELVAVHDRDVTELSVFFEHRCKLCQRELLGRARVERDVGDLEGVAQLSQTLPIGTVDHDQGFARSWNERAERRLESRGAAASQRNAGKVLSQSRDRQ
jgi:hypothetical protein